MRRDLFPSSSKTINNRKIEDFNSVSIFYVYFNSVSNNRLLYRMFNNNNNNNQKHKYKNIANLY